jgi:hypothetical protein
VRHDILLPADAGRGPASDLRHGLAAVHRDVSAVDNGRVVRTVDDEARHLLGKPARRDLWGRILVSRTHPRYDPITTRLACQHIE